MKQFIYIGIAIVLLSTVCWVNAQEAQGQVQAEESLQQEKRAGTCPGGGNCNGNGRCVNGTVCVCGTNWQGSDCSIKVVPITNGVPLTRQTVAARAWIFYTINTTRGSGLVVTVNQTTAGDVDVYLLSGGFPTTTHYSAKDTSSSANIQVIVDNAGVATWYIGVYGYLATTFTITVNVTTSLCPDLNNCNAPNGRCISAGVCSCNSGYAGSDCSVKLVPITLGKSYTTSVDRRAWKYYTLTLTSSNNLIVSVSQTTGDVDAYVKFGGALPDQYHYDFRDTSLKANFSISINEPSLGTWIFGFYGYQAAQFTFNVAADTRCPSNCSNHGTCRGALCQCNANYGGAYCQTMNSDMTLATPYPGFVDANSWNYYTVTFTSANNLLISVTENNNGDCDLYVKLGAAPTKLSYDYRDIGTQSNFYVLITEPSGTYHIGVYGYSQCDYTIQSTESLACPGTPSCTGHGTCTANGECICNNGYIGLACDTSVATITNGATVTGSVDTNGWQYFSISVRGTTFLSIELKETSTNGFLWLYVNKGFITPELRTSDYHLSETSNQFHHLEISFDTPTTDSFVIGVYGNPFSSNGPISFSLSAWYSPF